MLEEAGEEEGGEGIRSVRGGGAIKDAAVDSGHLRLATTGTSTGSATSGTVEVDRGLSLLHVRRSTPHRRTHH